MRLSTRLMSVFLLGLTPLSVSAQAGDAQIDAALSPWVAKGELSGFVTILIKDSKEVGTTVNGYADISTKSPMQKNTIFRAFSMTKPVTAVALMILHQQGKWNFSDPIAKYLPELSNLKVYRGTDASGRLLASPAASQPTMEQLVTHTAGFLYGFGGTPVDAEYRKSIPMVPTDMGAAKYLRALAGIPLAYEPGTQWQYSVGMDLEGIIVERLSGMPLRTFMKRHIFDPLKMTDTDFVVPAAKRSRFATLYAMNDGHLTPVTAGPFGQPYNNDPVQASGGGGLVTTAGDYARFATMLLQGGTLDGARILSPSSVSAIMSSHVDPARLQKGDATSFQFQPVGPGYGFGVNGLVVTDAAKAGEPVGNGTYRWDGIAGTWFWVDPTNHVVFVGMIQRMIGPGMPNVEELTRRVVAQVVGTRPAP